MQEVILYLGKPSLINTDDLPTTLRYKRATETSVVIEELARAGAEALAVVLDSDTIFQAGEPEEEGPSGTARACTTVTALRKVAHEKTKIIGVTPVDAFKMSLTVAGCEDACLVSELGSLLEGLKP